VLGLQADYIALANKLLPGFTTVATSPRYVSMLCAAVAAAEAAVPGAGVSTVRLALRPPSDDGISHQLFQLLTPNEKERSNSLESRCQPRHNLCVC
jgi:hypothetical protein